MMSQVLCVALLVGGATAASRNQGATVSPTLVLPSMSGRDIYQYFCATCHGRDGRGNGPLASELRTRPANLTVLAANSGGQFPVERVRAFVTHRGADTPTHGSPDMPVWGPIFQALDATDQIAQARIDNVVAYIRSIQSK